MYNELTREELIERLESKDRKWKEMVLQEHDLKTALEQANLQNDNYSHMVAELLKERREKNWMFKGVDKPNLAV